MFSQIPISIHKVDRRSSSALDLKSLIHHISRRYVSTWLNSVTSRSGIRRTYRPRSTEKKERKKKTNRTNSTHQRIRLVRSCQRHRTGILRSDPTLASLRYVNYTANCTRSSVRVFRASGDFVQVEKRRVSWSDVIARNFVSN